MKTVCTKIRKKFHGRGEKEKHLDYFIYYITTRRSFKILFSLYFTLLTSNEMMRLDKVINK